MESAPRRTLSSTTRQDGAVDPTVVLINVIGWIGMALLISAYALVTASRIPATGLAFQLMNLFGGGFLMNSAWYGAWPSAALNLVWVCIGTVGLTRAGLRRPDQAGWKIAANASTPSTSRGPGRANDALASTAHTGMPLGSTSRATRSPARPVAPARW